MPRRSSGEARRQRILGEVFDRSGDGILLADAASGALVQVNDRALDMLGYTRAEILARHLWEIAFPDPDPGTWRTWSAALTGELQVLDTGYRCRDGSVLPVEARICEVRDGDDVLHVAIFRDMSATRKTRQRCAMANATTGM